ncbi:MAG: GerMN domain-containing protein [Thermoanaerobaculia bacterium]
MSRRAASFVLGLALALLLGAGLWWWTSSRPGRRAAGTAAEVPAQPGEKVSFNLYFPSEVGLRAEARELEVPPAPRERIRRIVAALLAGPKTPGLGRPFPEGVVPGPVMLAADGTCWVDLRWDGHDTPPAGGSTEEIQRVYSVVNSVVLNVPQASRVVLLWNGIQRETFSGHLDLSRPLTPDRELASR